jgi:hypothetical protein
MSDANQTDGTEAAAEAGGADTSAARGPSPSASDAPHGEASNAVAAAKANATAGTDGSGRTTDHADGQAAGPASAKPAAARVANRPSPMRPMEHPGGAAGSQASASLTPVQRALVARGDRRELLDFLRRRRGA